MIRPVAVEQRTKRLPQNVSGKSHFPHADQQQLLHFSGAYRNHHAPARSQVIEQGLR